MEATLVLILSISDFIQGLISLYLKGKEDDKFALCIAAIHALEGVVETIFSAIISLNGNP